MGLGTSVNESKSKTEDNSGVETPKTCRIELYVHRDGKEEILS